MIGRSRASIYRLLQFQDDDAMAEHQEDAAKSRIYEALLQATPDLLYVFDIQHRFVYANQALLTM